MITKFQKIPKDKLIESIKNSTSYEQVFAIFKDTLSNGPRNRKSLKEFIKINDIDISHFDRNWYSKKQQKYQEVTKTCLHCGKEYKCLSGGKMYKETCSRRCSNYYFAFKRMTEETKEKISQGVNKYWEDKPPKVKNYIKKTRIKKQCSVNKNFDIIYDKVCRICKNIFSTNKKHTNTCSYQCSKSYTKDPVYRKKLSDIQKRRVINGTHQGWKTRNIESYPEKYFKFRLDELGIKYDFNYPIAKKLLGLRGASCYFLDFYFSDKKIDLEIDGKQHIYEDRVESDQKRDSVLYQNGIKVFRIAWKNPVNIENKKYIDSKIEEFLSLLNSSPLV